MRDFLAITGPTTSGKTQLSIAVAEALNGEIICMDSRQVYRGMNIGTDKVSAEHRNRVPHHGLDLRDPDEFYSAGQFGRDAKGYIEEISGRGHVPLLVGGTGLFLRSLTHPLFEQPDIDATRQRKLIEDWGRPMRRTHGTTFVSRTSRGTSALPTETPG